MVKIYIVSIDMEGSGADSLAYSIEERDRKYAEYRKYLTKNKLKGMITVREDAVNEKRAKEIKADNQYYFDTLDWDKTKIIFQKEY